MLNRLFLSSLLCLSAAAMGDTPGQHPAYLHALSDLRAARVHLEKRGGSAALKASDQAAIQELDACIEAVTQAAKGDAKNLNYKPHEDAGKDHVGDDHRARELMRSARRDIEKPESNAANDALRQTAIQHLDQALHHVDESIDKIKK